MTFPDPKLAAQRVRFGPPALPKMVMRREGSPQCDAPQARGTSVED